MPLLQAPAPYILRPLHLDDLEAVQRIEQLSMPTPTKDAIYRYELSQNKFAHYQALTTTQNSTDTLIGYAGFWLMADEAHISIIAIDPDWRRRGLGALLLLNLLHLACQFNAIESTLEVRRSNLAAQALYHKYGFTIVGERHRYYKDKEDALIMTAVLQNTPTCATLPQKYQRLYQHLTKSAD